MPTGRPGRTVSAATNVRFQPATLQMVQEISDRIGSSTSGTVRTIVNLWLRQHTTGRTWEERDGAIGQELDFDRCVEVLSEYLTAEEQDDLERRAAEASE